MKFHYILFLVASCFLVSCQGVSDNSLDGTKAKPEANINKVKANKKAKSIKKPLSEFITVDGVKQPYWKALNNFLGLNSTQISELKKITNKFQTSIKDVKKTDTQAQSKLRLSRNDSVQQLIGKKLARNKILFDKEYYNK